MDEDLVTVDAKYQERIAIKHLSMEPALQGARVQFTYENYLLEIALPTLPPENQQLGNPDAHAVVDVWNRSGEMLNIHINSILLCIHNLQFSLPKDAANCKHINAFLYNEDQSQELDNKSDQLYFLAYRALNYFFRVARWKTGFGLIDLNHQVERGASFGGRLFNVAHGGAFYSPRLQRTVKLPKRHRLTPSEWREIVAALASGSAPPISNEFFMSAEQRIENADLSAAVLDLTIVAEYVIRQAIDKQLPADTPDWARALIARNNISNVIDRWTEHGLPPAQKAEWFPILKKLFDRRNRLMHRGTTKDIDGKFCRKAAMAVGELVGALKY